MRWQALQKGRPPNDPNTLHHRHHHRSTIIHVSCSDSLPPMDILHDIVQLYQMHYPYQTKPKKGYRFMVLVPHRIQVLVIHFCRCIAQSTNQQTLMTLFTRTIQVVVNFLHIISIWSKLLDTVVFEKNAEIQCHIPSLYWRRIL